MRSAYLLPAALWLIVLSACENVSETERMRREPLKPLLAAIQEEVSMIGETPDHYYEDEYRPQEPLFWSKIAGWMVEDAILRNYPQVEPMSRILDLGCGFGTLLSFATTIYGVEGVCVDIIPYLQEKENVRNKYHITFIEGDLEREPLPVSGKFDVIIMTEVLEHFNFHPVPTLRKIWNVLADGGSFFLSTPDSDAGWGRNYTYYDKLSDIPPPDPAADWINAHVWHYNREELVQVLNEAGFEIKRLDHSQSGGGGHFNVWASK
jgi:SAM-dependent methyltransferase